MPKDSKVTRHNWHIYEFRDPVMRLIEHVLIKIPIPAKLGCKLQEKLSQIVRREIALSHGVHEQWIYGSVRPKKPRKYTPVHRPLKPSKVWLAKKAREQERANRKNNS